MRCQAFIFARGGSKGVPRKNVKMLGGKPLIAYSIEAALQAPSLGDVIVSTDDMEIAEVAKSLGARVPFLRPPALASDTASEWAAWQHALDWVERQEGAVDALVSIPTTSPFRNIADVEACVALLAGSTADAVITVKKADRSPYFNMVTLSAESVAEIAINSAGSVTRRQDAPEMFDMTTVAYAVRSEFVRKKAGLFEGEVRAIQVPTERALDIDTPYDFWLAELIMQARSSMAGHGGRG